jgi:hypothetical protein
LLTLRSLLVLGRALLKHFHHLFTWSPNISDYLINHMVAVCLIVSQSSFSPSNRLFTNLQPTERSAEELQTPPPQIINYESETITLCTAYLSKLQCYIILHRQEFEDLVIIVYLTRQQVHWCIQYAVLNNWNVIPLHTSYQLPSQYSFIVFWTVIQHRCCSYCYWTISGWGRSLLWWQ